MNGQDRSHPLATTSTGGSTSTVVSSNGAPSGAVNSQSWLRDIVGDPSIAAQAGIINPRHDAQTSLSNSANIDASSHSSSRPPLNRFPFNPLLHPLYSGSNGSAGGIPASYSHGLQNVRERSTAPHTVTSSLAEGSLSAGIPDQQSQRLFMASAASLPTDSLSSRPHFSLPHKIPNRDPLSTNKSPAMSDVDHSMPAKRSKAIDDNSSAGKSAAVVQPHHAVPAIPHRPDYFHKGSVIQLSEQKLKRIEDLQTADFEQSAEISANLSLDSSTVVKIVEDKMRGTAFLTFSVGDRPRQKQVSSSSV